MALTNLRVKLARPMVGSGVAERSMIGSCTTTRSMIGSCVMTISIVGSHVVQKHTQSMIQLLNLVYAVCTWKSGRLNQISDIPVPQIEKERVKANQLAPQERTQQHINEPKFTAWNGIRNLYSEDIKVLQA